MRWGDSIKNMEQWFALRQKPENFINRLSFGLLGLIKEAIEKQKNVNSDMDKVTKKQCKHKSSHCLLLPECE